jgi:hypothetical protein
MAVAYRTEWLGRDVSREEGRRLEELMEQEYRKFEESVSGYSTQRANYFDCYQVSVLTNQLGLSLHNQWRRRRSAR